MKTIQEIISFVEKNDLNEADTRFTVIDFILKNTLSWPVESVSCEKITSDGRIDYLLKNKAGRPAFILEAKRSGTYFELPSTLNSKKNFQTLKVEKLLTDKNIKSAILQTKEYCEDIGCNYCGITNGKTWIIIHINPQNISWKKLPAFVIKDLSFFSESYTTAVNLLGYESIVNANSLRKKIGSIRSTNDEIYYPKDSIVAYDIPVNTNKYAPILNIISRKFLGNIPVTEYEFMKQCYVTNRGNYDILQHRVEGVIFDSITPFFKSEGFKELHDSDSGGEFATKIEELILQENYNNVLILFGGRGSGKSTFLQRLFLKNRPQEIDEHAQISIINLLHAPQDKKALTEEIWNLLVTQIDVDKLLDSSRETLLTLFSDKFSIFKKQILAGLDEKSETYQEKTTDFIIEHKSNKRYVAERLSRYLKAKRKGLILILDNLDQFPPELQDVCFLTATEIANKLSCLVIISMREERYYRVKTKGVLDAYHIQGFHLPSPVIPDVLVKRLSFILEKLSTTLDLDSEFDIRTHDQLRAINSFLNICFNEIKRRESALSKFMRYSTHGDVRMALNFFKNFLTSGYTNINEMIQTSDWKFQIHQVIKPMMIPDRFFYNEKTSQIPNIFQLRNDNNSSHLSGIRILDHLNKKSNLRTEGGFVDAKNLVQEFDYQFYLKEDCEKNLDIFLAKGLIESSNRLESYSHSVDQIRITAFGKYFVEKLSKDFTYLDLVALDCGLFDESLVHEFVSNANREYQLYQNGHFYDRINLRLNKVEKFLDYLHNHEVEELTELNLLGQNLEYIPKLKTRFRKQKIKILESAERKLDNQGF